MFRVRFIAIMATTAAVLFSASAFAATKYAVGTCQPRLTSYSTISQAVSSVPSGSTVEVCPGNYPEQVLITQPLTLQGVSFQGSDAAVVTVPSGGLGQNVNSPSCRAFGKLYYQVLVQTTGPVDIRNLVVDGTGGSGAICVAGIYYQDSSGTVSEVSARNQPNIGLGILAETILGAAQEITVENSVVRGFGFKGIVANSTGGPLTANIKANTIDVVGDETSGIFVSGLAGGTIQSNVISTSANNGGNVAGIFLYHSTVEATANTIIAGPSNENNDYAFLIEAGSVTVTKNRIDAGGQLGLNLQNTGTASVVEQNTIVNSSTAIAGCADTLGYTVSGNTIIDAAVGVQLASGNTSGPNKFYATAMSVPPCN
ncbi:MAG: right-handed parallel beta-helix repeat-containing protein [Terriglobales bacterium]